VTAPTKEEMAEEQISAATVKALRDRTGAGFMDCKRALADAGGDLDRAAALLKERGMAAAARKSEREAREGTIASYIHPGGRLGVLIEVNCETDFVARTDDFQKLVRDLAMAVAGMAPRYVTVDSIPEVDLTARRAELEADPETRRKPEQVRGQIIEGQLRKWSQGVGGVLYEQPFRDTDQTVGQLVTEAIARIGENIVVRRFTRYQLGEDS
jgi:elongation factor Ts